MGLPGAEWRVDAAGRGGLQGVCGEYHSDARKWWVEITLATRMVTTNHTLGLMAAVQLGAGEASLYISFLRAIDVSPP
jgi:hypothetical protein